MSATASVHGTTRRCRAVQLTNPVNGSFVQGTMPIQASASDGCVRDREPDRLGRRPDPPRALAADVEYDAVGSAVRRTRFARTADDNAGNLPTTASVTVDNSPPAAPAVAPLQSPVAGKPTLTWQPAANTTYRVARTSSTGPGSHAFTGR